MIRVRIDRLTKGSSKIQFNLFLGKLDQLFFDHACWWWPKDTPFFIYSAKEGKKWITKQIGLKKSISHKWQNKNRPSSPSGIPSGTTLRHKKSQHSSGRLFIRQWQLTSGAVKSWWRSTKVAPVVALRRWNRLNTCLTVVPLLNTCGDTLPTSFGNSLSKNKKSRPAQVFFHVAMCFFFINLCAKHSNSSVTSSFS